MEKEDILVCVKCWVFNHERYLRECLDGFVMQQTNFRFVAVVHDDCSTDGSAVIIREYANKYPEIIKPIYEVENQWCKHDGSLQRIMDDAVNANKPKYIAMCEGDDYWTDPYKLQKQVDFLESHPDYSMCFHAASIKNDANAKVITTCDKIEDNEYGTNDIFPGWVVPTASVVYRKCMIDTYPPIKHAEWVKYGDIVLFLKCTHVGRVWGMSDKMSVYRMTENGAVISQRNEDKCDEKKCRHYQCLMENFPQLDKTYPNGYIATFYYTQFRQGSKLLSKWHYLMIALRHSPIYVFKKMLRIKTAGVY